MKSFIKIRKIFIIYKGTGYHIRYLFCLALFVKIVVFKTKLFKVDWSGSARLLREQRDR